MNRPILQIILIIFFFSLVQSCAEKKDYWSIEENSEGILIKEKAEKVLFYQRATKSLDGKFERSNYIHPLYGLDGNVLTEDFPEDHLHHRGIFWTWHQNYVGNKSVGDAWALENFSWEVTDSKATISDNGVLLNTVVNWKSPLWLDANGKQKAFAREKARIKVFSKEENYRVIDYEIEITALEDSLSIGGSEDEKGYSGFSWRIKLPEDVKFEGENGEVEPTKLAIDAGAWMNLSGSLSQEGSKEGVIVVSHDSNPYHPQPWILRNKRSMQNAAFPGRDRYSIPKNKPLLLKYRMIVYQGELKAEVINKLSKF
ncbi:MAG: hypothetical protein ACJA2S_002089 [Cyclobacteriaceae bacterium]|jgi:hypothetical protein